MARILVHCPTCKKVATTKSEMRIGALTIRTYECGHVQTFKGAAPAQTDTLDVTSLDNKHPFPFQIAGAQFAERANARVLIADEMGLGKTVQFCILMAAHPEWRPFVVFVKSGLRLQWYKENLRWGDLMCQVIDGTTDEMLKGFDGYIISLDTSWRMGHKAVRTKKSVRVDDWSGQEIETKGGITYVPIPGKTLVDQMKKCNIKTVGIDECQLIKNADSKRTKAIQAACSDVEHVIGMSGTPIKNNAAEYFPILNILRPDKFPSKAQFVYGWCDSYHDGYQTKTGGLKNPPAFLEYTKDFIIRRERKEVLPDLPSIFRQNSFCDLGEMVEEEYKKTIKEYQDYYNDSGDDSGMQRSSNILAYLSKMRHLTGLAKIGPVSEYVEEFITSTDRKIVIFVHHKDVGELLKSKLSNMAREWPAEWGPEILSLTSDMDAYAREECLAKLAGNCRVMIASTLASGEGLNMQFCSDCIMMERQWNPANEEQCEARFPRPGQTADKINAIYFTAVGTVDEFFGELVEQKREIVMKTLSGKAAPWSESSLVGELAQILAEKGGRKWGW